MPRLVTATVFLILFVGPCYPHFAESQQTEIVTGVLEDLDLKAGKGRIRTDLGKPLFFQVAKPELFKDITVGEHISVQLDEQGRAVKVIDVPPPELKHPLQ